MDTDQQQDTMENVSYHDKAITSETNQTESGHEQVESSISNEEPEEYQSVTEEPIGDEMEMNSISKSTSKDEFHDSIEQSEVVLQIHSQTEGSSNDQHNEKLDADINHSAESLISYQPIHLKWKKVGYSVPVGRFRNVQMKPLLDKVSGSASPGELLAIMGASGAGKSTLLNVLAGRIGAGALEGVITINDRLRSPATWKSIIGYVEQEDLMYQNLTVRETLTFAAMMRLPYSMSYEEKIKRVDDVISELALGNCENTIIGDSENRGISGGEKKRVSIGIELITRPSLIFADEPTSGLDSFTAANIIESLKKIAENGKRTVLITVHQPREYILNMFDNIILLSAGSVIYSGDVPGALSHFEKCGFKCPSNTNPSDFFLDTMSVDFRSEILKENSARRLSILRESWFANEDEKSFIAKEAVKGRKIRNNPFWYELITLLKRNIKDMLRDKMTLGATVGQSIVNMIIVGLIFMNMDLSFAGIQNRIGSLFFIAIQLAFGNVMPTIIVFTLQKQIIKRERASGTYRASSAYLAKIFSQFPVTILATLLFGIPVYWIIGLQPVADKFFIFLLAICVHAVSAMLLGIAISSGVPSVQVGQIVGPTIVVIFLIMGGQIVNLDSVTPVLRWIRWISIVYYTYMALAMNEMDDLTFDCNPDVPVCETKPTGESVLTQFDLNLLGNVFTPIWICTLISLGFALLGYFMFRRQSRPLMKLK